MPRLVALALCAAVTAAPAGAAARMRLYMAGNSTTYGPAPGAGTQSVFNPASTLQAVLRLAPYGTAFRGARVTNFGVPASTARDWAVAPPAGLCAFFALPQAAPAYWRLPFARLLARACEEQVPLGVAAAALAPDADGWLVMVGTNDVLHAGTAPEVADHLAILVGLLPGRVWLAPPLPATLEPHASWATAVRAELLSRGLVTGPDWPPIPLADGLHATPGGLAAVAGMWIDYLE